MHASNANCIFSIARTMNCLQQQITHEMTIHHKKILSTPKHTDVMNEPENEHVFVFLNWHVFWYGYGRITDIMGNIVACGH